MKKIFLLSVLVWFNASFLVKADEGMWLLPLIEKLNIGTMNQMGLELSAEQIYSVNHSSLKDAIVIFGPGCTGELVSDQGLIFTNHHCGYSSIQQLSSMTHNYLEDGFWARNFEDELPVEGLSVTFLKSIEEVTSLVTAKCNDSMDEKTRQSTIKQAIDSLTSDASKGNSYKISIQRFFAGNQYWKVTYEVFSDVRLVGTPPSSIGKFGHDTDNWMWPRHTGDFSIFRVYASPEGKPASFSTYNVPLKPKHFLPISIKGYEPGDFAMTLGFPGSTERYLTSWGIEEQMQILNKSRIHVRGIKQEIWLKDMLASEKVNIQYSDKYAKSSNYWKNSIGMNLGLEKLKIIAQKQQLESDFIAWMNQDASRKALYSEAFDALKGAYASRKEKLKALQYLSECLIRGTELYTFAASANDLKIALESKDDAKIKTAKQELQKKANLFYKDYHAATDKKVMSAMLAIFCEEITPSFHPDFINEINVKYKKQYRTYAQKLFKTTIFADSSSFYEFLAKPSLKKLTLDLAYRGGMSIRQKRGEILEQMKPDDIQINRGERLFLKGRMEMEPDKAFYPDANFTMRLSYGSVGDYMPRDAVLYKHFTTLKGVIEKEDSANWEFVVDPKLKDLYQRADYGRYADGDGSLHVCFTTNNDITGGNSGSPVINGKGELIGLAFDGNWEAMSGDIAFENELQKCINVDIRYVLFVIDKFAGADNLINELTIVD